MSSGTIVLLLLLLACPLMMVFMHRGGHSAHGGHGSDSGHPHSRDTEPTLDELRQRRDELHTEIETLEVEESRPKAPLAG